MQNKNYEFRIYFWLCQITNIQYTIIIEII